MKVMISGAAGFIGSNLANFLDLQGYDLTLVDSLEYGGIVNRLNENLRSKLIIHDMREISEMNYVKNADIIIHLAGISSLPANEKDPIASIRNNFMTTVNLYELATKSGVDQFYFASTSAVYENTSNVPFFENSEIVPDLFYSYSKKISEDYLQLRSSKRDGINTTVLRFFNVFGSGQNTLRNNPPLTGYLVERFITNKQIVIYNNTDVKRDYIHVSDILKIIDKLISKRGKEGKRFEIFNMCSGNAYSVPQILSMLEKLTGKILNVTFGEPSEIWSSHTEIFTKISEERVSKEVFKESLGSNEKLMNFLSEGYDFIDLSEGLGEMLELGYAELSNKQKG